MNGPKRIDFRARRRRRRRRATARLQDVAEPQHQLARLEGLRQVVVGADLEARARGRPVSARAVSIRIGTCDVCADAAGVVEAVLARHHHVEHEGVEDEALALAPAPRRRSPPS